MRPLYTLPLPEALLSALNKSGFHYLEDLILRHQPDGQDEVSLIIKSFNLNWDDVQAWNAEPGCISAAQLLRREQMNEYIPTFSESIDRLLGGGVMTDSILQVCGPPGSGKTQLGLQLCVNVQIPISLGGLGAESVFIDTERTFSPTRLREIASAASDHCKNIARIHKILGDTVGFTADYIMSRIYFIDVGNLTQLVASVKRLDELLQQNLNIKLIVMDSITFPFLKISNSLERTRCISVLVQDLQRLATKYNLAIVLTNHLTTKISQETKVLAPSLGESLSHLVQSCLLLGAVERGFSALIYKSGRLKEEVVNFKVLPKGIRDA